MAVISNFVYLNENGFHYPDYETILGILKKEYQNIYGADVYLENDSQDGQWIAIQALAIYEIAEVAGAIYSSFSPTTAYGDALTRNVKINGLRRQSATYSTADLKIVGEVGTQIINGIAKDQNDQKWLLPESVTIGTEGEVLVSATAENIGAIKALAGTITKIHTPQKGWQSVTNPADAVVGKSAETDFALRLRQSRSVSIPSQTVLEGIAGALYSLENVEKLKIVENATAQTDDNGLPPHSFALIIKGGDVDEITKILAIKKTIGTDTYGDLSFSYTDKYGISTKYKFSRPTEITISVQITIKALAGYLNSFADVIKAKIVEYISALGIGETLYLSKLYVPANLTNNTDGQTFDVLDLKIKKGDGEFSTQNIVLAFKEMAVCTLDNVEVILDKD